MEWLKDLLKKWKVQVSVAGGVVIIATAWGTCNYEPDLTGGASSDEPILSEEMEPASTTTTTEASTSTTAEKNATTAADTTATETE